MKQLTLILVVSFLLCGCVSTKKNERLDSVPVGTKNVSIVIPVYSQKISLNLPNSDWRPSFEDSQENTYRVEIKEMKEGQQTDWTELVSVQGFKEFTALTPQELLDFLADKTQKPCPKDYKYQALGPVKMSGYDGAKGVIGCSQYLGENGPEKGEIGYYFAVKGEKDLYLIHKAYRGQSTEINKLLDEEFAKKFIADILPIKICKKAGHEAECIE